MDLTPIGAFATKRTLDGRLIEAAQVAERLGFGTFWLGGSPRLSEIGALVAATERIVIATGIVNVWTYEPEQLAAEYVGLGRDHPDRVLVGLGIGHPEATQEYEKPLGKMHGFLGGLAAARHPIPAEALCLAALGPKMLALSAARTRGTHPYFTPPAHTRLAREAVGPDRLVAPELACVLDDDPQRARAAAREYAGFYLGLSNYRGALLRSGFDEADLADGGSQRLLDTIVPQGGAERIAAVVDEHLRAGADHVCVQAVGVTGVPEREWTELARVLIG